MPVSGSDEARSPSIQACCHVHPLAIPLPMKVGAHPCAHELVAADILHICYSAPFLKLLALVYLPHGGMVFLAPCSRISEEYLLKNQKGRTLQL